MTNFPIFLQNKTSYEQTLFCIFDLLLLLCQLLTPAPSEISQVPVNKFLNSISSNTRHQAILFYSHYYTNANTFNTVLSNTIRVLQKRAVSRGKRVPFFCSKRNSVNKNNPAGCESLKTLKFCSTFPSFFSHRIAPCRLYYDFSDTLYLSSP